MSISITSNKNYLKRDTSSGSTDMSAPATLQAWGGHMSTFVVAHNLGYIPLVRVYFDSANNGKIYPACGSRVSYVATGLSTGNDIICTYEVDETSLTIFLDAFSSQTGTRPVYWVIYRDQA